MSKVKTIVVLNDIHVPNHDKRSCHAVFDFLEKFQPDEVILNGDIADFESISSFDKPLEVEASFSKEVADVKSFLNDIRNSVPKAEIHYVKGNHECIESHQTEVLTFNGWVTAKNITLQDEVAQFDMATGAISYSVPDKVIQHTSDHIVEVKSYQGYELVTKNHSLVVDEKRIKVSDAMEITISQRQQRFAGKKDSLYDLDPLIARYLTWVICDGCLVRRGNKVHHIQFKLSKQRKIDRLRELLGTLNIPYTFKLCKKTGINKLQPHYIRIYGQYARDVERLLHGKKQFPSSFQFLSENVARAIVTEIAHTDGTFDCNSIIWSTTSKEDAQCIQMMCIFNNIPCKVSFDRERRSGFNNGKLQQIVLISPNGLSSKFLKYKIHEGAYDVTSIQMPKETLITRVNGIVNFTGNCRLDKYLSRHAKALECFEGLTLAKVLDFKKYKINYNGKRFLIRDGVMYSHLDKASSNPAGSAKAIGMKNMCDVIHGHTHNFSVQKYAGYTFIENGCLCEIQQSYVDGPSHFKQAFTVIYRHNKQNYYQLIPIENHGFYYGNKRYQG